RLTRKRATFTPVPSPSVRKEGDTLSDDAKAIVREINDLIGRDVPSLNQKLEAAKLKPLKAPGQVHIAKNGVVAVSAELDGSDRSDESVQSDEDESDG